jgi:hypothetical protein
MSVVKMLVDKMITEKMPAGIMLVSKIILYELPAYSIKVDQIIVN